MDDMIKEKLALKEQVDSLEQNLSKQIKEKESLLQTFTVFKNESKEKENKYMENKIDLEKKIKELDNIIFKVGQSAQTMHMLTKPQVFYDNIHKQALGYQNPFYLKKAQRIKPTLYDGIVISDKHVAMPVIDDEETMILEEESRSKMSEKEKDPEAIKQNISHKPIDYVKLNRLSDDFGKRFVPQQELTAEQAFWFHMSKSTIKSSDASLVKIEAPKELPKVSLVNESLKKLKFYLARFDNVVKIRTTPDARTEDIFNVFDKDLLNEIMEVQTVFDQMDAAVQQSSVDKQCLGIAKKELLLENDRLLQQIMSQDVLLTVMNSMSLFGESVNMERKRNESCDKCFNLDAELLKTQNAHNDLLKKYFKNNDLEAQLTDTKELPFWSPGHSVRPWKRSSNSFVETDPCVMMKAGWHGVYFQILANNLVLKAITDRMTGALPSDTVKNPKLNVNSTSPVLSARSYPTEDPQCSTRIHSSINAITICPKRPGEFQNGKPEQDEQEEKDNPENIYTNPSSPPDPSVLCILKCQQTQLLFVKSIDLVIFDEKKLGVLRKFHWMILRGRMI
ncbi:hypothetical protein Tco_1145370 [Tanacetum coccineum]